MFVTARRAPVRVMCTTVPRRDVRIVRRLSQEQQRVVKENIKNGIFKRIAFDQHQRDISTVLFTDTDVFTGSHDGSIKCWNVALPKLHTYDPPRDPQLQWSYRPTPFVRWRGKIHLVNSGKSIVCSGLADDNTDKFHYHPTVHVISKKSGLQEASFVDPRIKDESNVAVIGDRIFTKFPKENLIGEWNSWGKPVCHIHSPDYTKIFRSFFSHDNKLMTLGETFLSICDPETDDERRFDFPKDLRVTSANFDKNSMLAGIERGKYGSCFLLDFKKDFIPRYFDFNEAFLYREKRIWGDWTETYAGYPTAITRQNDWAFIGDIKGIVVAANLKTEKTHTLGKHRYSVSDLVVEQDILISGSKTEIKFWDLADLKLLGKVDLYGYGNIRGDLCGLHWKDGKLTAAIGSSLAFFDYLNSRQ